MNTKRAGATARAWLGRGLAEARPAGLAGTQIGRGTAGKGWGNKERYCQKTKRTAPFFPSCGPVGPLPDDGPDGPLLSHPGPALLVVLAAIKSLRSW